MIALEIRNLLDTLERTRSPEDRKAVEDYIALLETRIEQLEYDLVDANYCGCHCGGDCEP